MSFSQRLLVLGMILFLAGLLSGLVIAEMPNSRMGLAAHLEGVMNGVFMVAVGLVWDRLLLSSIQKNLLFGCYSTAHMQTLS
ncbi:MAG: hypothetical protein V2I33_15560 [Kangiellaceae bacterium]|jgi:hydroxylaminobenzene mutase|nr:hypothetical protein [Kangiellaceae bacterium]